MLQPKCTQDMIEIKEIAPNGIMGNRKMVKELSSCRCGANKHR